MFGVSTSAKHEYKSTHNGAAENTLKPAINTPAITKAVTTKNALRILSNSALFPHPFKEKNIPESLKKIPITKPGSRFLK